MGNLQDLTTITALSILHNIQNAAGPLAGVIFLLFLTAAADTATGLYAAWKSDTLSVEYIDTFVTSHVQNKWLPILGTLFGGVALGGVDNVLGGTLIAAATAQIVAYEVATMGGSISQNLTAAADGTKGLPGQTALSPLLVSGQIGQTVDSVPLNSNTNVPQQTATFHPNGALASITIAALSTTTTSAAAPVSDPSITSVAPPSD